MKIADYLEKIRERLVIICCMNTLEYLHKGGRLSATVTILGGMLNIKPVVASIKDGQHPHPPQGTGHQSRRPLDGGRCGRNRIRCLPPHRLYPLADNPEGAVEARSCLAEKATWLRR